jgi:hypothetical protein
VRAHIGESPESDVGTFGRHSGALAHAALHSYKSLRYLRWMSPAVVGRNPQASK